MLIPRRKNNISHLGIHKTFGSIVARRIANFLRLPPSSNKTNMLNFILSLLLVAINIWVIVYLYRLESIGCKCAMDFRRTYVIAYLIVSLVYSAAVGVLMYLFRKSSLPVDSKVPAITLGVLSLVMLLAGILYIVFGLQYIERLKEEKCECSEDLARDVWQVVLYIHIAFLVLMVLLILTSYSAWGYKVTKDAILTGRPPSEVIEGSTRKASSGSRRIRSSSSRGSRSN